MLHVGDLIRYQTESMPAEATASVRAVRDFTVVLNNGHIICPRTALVRVVESTHKEEPPMPETDQTPAPETHPCLGCNAPIAGKRQRCKPCQTKHQQALWRAAYQAKQARKKAPPADAEPPAPAETRPEPPKPAQAPAVAPPSTIQELVEVRAQAKAAQDRAQSLEMQLAAVTRRYTQLCVLWTNLMLDKHTAA